PRMLFAFFSGSITIFFGFIVAFIGFKPLLLEGASYIFGVLASSWIGGSANMVAVQTVLGIPEDLISYAVAVDVSCLIFTTPLFLWLRRYADKFNRWTKADTSKIEDICNAEALSMDKGKIDNIPVMESITLLIGASLVASAVCCAVGGVLEELLPFFDASTWAILIVTIVGLLLAMTPLGRMYGVSEVAQVILYILIALLASRANMLAILDVPILILSGFLTLLIHFALMILIAKVFKLDLFSVTVSSEANLGGSVSAPIVASAFGTALVPVGIVMALIGYVIGTWSGIAMVKCLALML
ncbi:MAG: DUF819 family protein, partial [Enterococcus sp.]|nr:DUF819 family protein [Enterococcus sp.]